MFKTATANRVGYAILAVGCAAGLFGAYRNDSAIKNVNEKQTRFIIDQCLRDDKRNDIVIESLQGAKRRAIITYRENPVLLEVELFRIQEQINEFKNSPPCKLP